LVVVVVVEVEEAVVRVENEEVWLTHYVSRKSRVKFFEVEDPATDLMDLMEDLTAAQPDEVGIYRFLVLER
jgi:hypothetical protein